MPDEELPTFEVQDLRGRPMMVCTYKGQIGAARIFSAGEQDARDRAEKAARDKVARLPPSEA